MSRTGFFDSVKQQVDLADYLTEHLHADLVPDGPGRMSALCPFHEEDTPSFKVTETDDGYKTWYCYGSCSTGGTVIDAAMRAEDFEYANDAVQFLNELYDLGLDANSDAYKQFAKTVEEAKENINKTQKEMEEDSPAAKRAKAYMHNRGYSDETLEHFGLAVDTTFAKAGRLSIPLIDKANHPVSMDSRALFDGYKCKTCGEYVEAKEIVKQKFINKKLKENGEPEIDWKACPRCEASGTDSALGWLSTQHPKYRFIGGFDKSMFLYNQNNARKVVVRDETIRGLFVVEGYADVWAGHQSGHEAIVSYNGSVLSNWQAKEIVEMMGKTEKPVILIPDNDQAGSANIIKNIEKLRNEKKDLEIQVAYGFDRFKYLKNGVEVSCKDLGEILQHHGTEAVSDLLEHNSRPASEWQIREIINHKNEKTGEPFFSQLKQMQLASQVLMNEESRASLDHLVFYLAEEWEKQEDIIRTWFYSSLSEANVTSYEHLFKDIEQARDEAREFLNDDNVVPLGFKGIDACLPGGGARPGQLMMFLGKSGTGKTMLASQILANMADHGVRSVFLSLEQAAKSLYTRLACQALDISVAEVEELLEKDENHDSEELNKVDELYKNMLIVDNVPVGDQAALSMTPARVQAVIQQANLTRFKGTPASVVIIDHLGILEVDDDAPSDVKRSELAAPGHIMQRLFSVCKATGVFMMVLQQLPKEVAPGVVFGYDAGRGGSKQTDFCDYICQIWRPEQQVDLDDEDRLAVEGQYKLALGKNRYGSSTVEHLFFDKKSLRIMPALEITQPDQINEKAVEGFEDNEEGDPLVISQNEEIEGDIPLIETSKDAPASGEIGMSPKALAEKAKETETTPEDAQALLNELGAEEDNTDNIEQQGDPDLIKWFES